MKMGVSFAAALLAAAVAPLGACANQQGNNQPTTSSGAPAGAERMITQLKGADGTAIANATFDFTNGYATVTVEAGPNQVLTPGFHALMVHSVGQCQANSTAPTGGSTGDFYSAGDVYQAQNHTGSPASGDLTALQVRPDGSAKLVTTTSAFTAADLRNSLGTALDPSPGPGQPRRQRDGRSGQAGGLRCDRRGCRDVNRPRQPASARSPPRSPCRRRRRARAPSRSPAPRLSRPRQPRP